MVKHQVVYTGKETTLKPPYLPSKDLKEAVNLAIFLERPLLLQGEPGCGKTRLARAVAHELGLDDKKHYFPEYVKSTHRARELLYRFDAVARLRDAQLIAAYAAQKDSEKLKEMSTEKLDKYLTYGALGNAFQVKDKRAVVLIDEIDKADIDFPNDLLRELEEGILRVEEVPAVSELKAKHMPIVFITSNSEKELPDAFLRRCIYFYIEFPSRADLIDIINAHFPETLEDKALAEAAVARFIKLREQMEGDQQTAGKKVSTSELIDWFRVLKNYAHDGDEVLGLLNGRLPYPSILLKSWESHKRYLTEMQAS